MERALPSGFYLTGWRMCFALALFGASLPPATVATAQNPPSNEASQEKSKGPPRGPAPAPLQSAHRFWDAKNAALFAGVGGARALDYASTQHFRKKGVNEWLLTNRIVDNKPLFAAIEVGGAAASIGVAYLFHRTGHHKLERWVSVVHISVGTGGAIRNFNLEPRQPVPAPP